MSRHLIRALLGCAFVVNFLWAFGVLWGLPPLGRDVPQFYAAGRLVSRGDVSRLYEREAYEGLLPPYVKIEDKYSIYFNRPAFAALPLFPAAFMSYETFAVVEMAANFGLLALLVWKLPQWFPGFPHARIWLFAFRPFIWSIQMGQDTLLLTLLLALGIRLLQRGRDVQGGAVLALCLIKPQIVWFVPVALAIKREWRALGAYAGTGLIAALLSFALVGPSGVVQWLDILRAPTTDLVPQRMGNVRAIALNGWPVLAMAIATAVLTAFAVCARRRRTDLAVASALFAGPILSIHTYWQDFSPAAIVALLCPYSALRYVIFLASWIPGPPYAYIAVGIVFLVTLARRRDPSRSLSPTIYATANRGGEH